MAEKAKLRLRIVAQDKKFMMLSYRNNPIEQVINKIKTLYKQLYDTDIQGTALLTIDGYQLPNCYIIGDLVVDNALLHLHTETRSLNIENSRPLKHSDHHSKHAKSLQPSSPITEELPNPADHNIKKRQRPEKSQKLQKPENPEKQPQKKKKSDEQEETEPRPAPTSKLLSLFNAPIKKESSLGPDENLSSDDSVFITHEEPKLPKGKPNLFRS